MHHDSFDTFVDGRSMTIDVVLEDDETPEQAAAWLASTPAAKGKVDWTVVHEHGPGGDWPMIRFDAAQSLDDRAARNALFGVYQRWNGVNAGKQAGKPPAARGQKR